MSARALHEVHLRPMRVLDLDEVMRIESSAHRHPWSFELMRRELEHDWSRAVLAVERAGLAPLDLVERIVGYIVFWLVHDELHVLNVATDPAFRRRGAGRTLMLEAEAHGHRHGARLSTLEVRRSNTAALKLYGSLGYREVGVRRRYYQEDGEDALIMLKDLAVE